jgi:hypothetical protein
MYLDEMFFVLEVVDQITGIHRFYPILGPSCTKEHHRKKKKNQPVIRLEGHGENQCE